MSDAKFLMLANGFRVRAEEIWARSETMYDAHARQKMRVIAVSYENLAQRIEQRLRRQPVRA
jgi:hypothetical protein